MTNEDKLKSLSTGELAEKFSKMIGTCAQCQIESFCSKLSREVKFSEKAFCLKMWEQWLKSEAEDND